MGFKEFLKKATGPSQATLIGGSSEGQELIDGKTIDYWLAQSSKPLTREERYERQKMTEYHNAHRFVTRRELDQAKAELRQEFKKQLRQLAEVVYSILEVVWKRANEAYQKAESSEEAARLIGEMVEKELLGNNLSFDFGLLEDFSLNDNGITIGRLVVGQIRGRGRATRQLAEGITKQIGTSL